MTKALKTSFKARVYQWANKIDVSISSISVRKMSRKWASCSTAGHLTFDCKLLNLPNHLQDYVIVHELMHLKIPNHGKMWKCLMTAHLGDYSALEDELKNTLATKGSK